MDYETASNGSSNYNKNYARKNRFAPATIPRETGTSIENGYNPFLTNATHERNNSVPKSGTFGAQRMSQQQPQYENNDQVENREEEYRHHKDVSPTYDNRKDVSPTNDHRKDASPSYDHRKDVSPTYDNYRSHFESNVM